MLVADRYQLNKPLGRGAIGEVWHATDHVLNRPVAVKLLLTGPEGQAADADAERFRREGRTAARLNHPNVVSVYDFGSHQGRLYLVMELVEGRTLAEELTRRTVLEPEEAVAIGAQVAAGLSAAHRQQVIHRDIKPGNIMLTADGTVKITDFGIARFADAIASTLTTPGKIAGSAAYLAPERAVGRTAQPPSDVYSLGCVLYEALTGRLVFPGTTALAMVRQQVDATPVPPTELRPEIPRPLADCVLTMLAKDPAQRPTADQAAAWFGEAGQRPESTDAPPENDSTTTLAALPSLAEPSATGDRGHWARGRRLPPKVLLGLAGAALLAGTVAVSTSLDSDDSAPAPPPAATTRTSSAPAPSTEPPTPRPAASPSSSEPRRASESEGPPDQHKAEEATKDAGDERGKKQKEDRKKARH
ncbi:serine/threonine-protein kinase [Streptomyces cavernae]|uniref:serine/threonine-protein kinase n=1 Tax=Streptomyces cavernae TaxID=2259034 RepID=UPI000FEC08CA|nr:serine/threonine-protein kinase [Streptomyces cavernae]